MPSQVVLSTSGERGWIYNASDQHMAVARSPRASSEAQGSGHACTRPIRELRLIVKCTGEGDDGTLLTVLARALPRASRGLVPFCRITTLQFPTV